jgi:AcrR family transcriptional regulator
MRLTKDEAAITREHLLKKGYAAATLEDIARKAEVTRGATY